MKTKRIARNNDKLLVKQELAACIEDVRIQKEDIKNFKEYIEKTNKGGKKS